MSFCIFHQYCPISGDNGHCTKYVGTTRVNRGVVRCGDITALPEDKFVVKAEVKKMNALKASKREAAGK
jgi:hypothetical protein